MEFTWCTKKLCPETPTTLPCATTGALTFAMSLWERAQLVQERRLAYKFLVFITHLSNRYYFIPAPVVSGHLEFTWNNHE